MGLGIYVKDLRRDEIGFLIDDPEDSFRRMCEAAPRESLRAGVSRYGDTLFNSLQLRRLIEELEALPPNEVTPVVQAILDSAQLAIRRSGYLLFIGD
ncbi:hypothetical protein [Streptomyces sp. ISL-94]|uniref:hypothetical protein n=1 Tax=Streptomyces sp. ISL-94 TaxID=2819190 RepID=UPI001BE7CF3F|nr:hypothetical protein [Streptomyces sp. ISL-94]MBT2477369.1 hypothetical protein [Streptomyces sp. ISL-94]